MESGKQKLVSLLKRAHLLKWIDDLPFLLLFVRCCRSNRAFVAEHRNDPNE